MPKITPFLWFDNQAEEAAELYASIFPHSKIVHVQPGPEGTAMVVQFQLDGTEFTALNGGPANYGFNEGVSFVIDCRDQAEVDHYWEALTADGGQPGPCGWLKDRYGLSWQVIPAALNELLADPDPGRSGRATAALDISDGLLADCGHIAQASGVALRIERDQCSVSVVQGTPDLSAGAVDLLDREWAASLSTLWTRDSRSGQTLMPAWKDPAFQAPFVSLMADAGLIRAMSADGGIVEGRNAVTPVRVPQPSRDHRR